MAKKQRNSSDEMKINLTSMLDIVFLLIIFFLLVVNFTAQDVPELEIPKPDVSQSYELDTERIIINVIPTEAEGTSAKEIIISGVQPIPYSEVGKLTEYLKQAVDREGGDPEKVQVDLRAGAHLAYDQIAPVINAVTQARIARINMVAHQEQ